MTKLPTREQWEAAALKQAADIIGDADFTAPRGGIRYVTAPEPARSAPENPRSGKRQEAIVCLWWTDLAALAIGVILGFVLWNLL